MMSTLIGVILAFITVLLLLSLIVMAMVQTTQSLLRLRGRNLLVGVAAVLGHPQVERPLRERIKDVRRRPEALKTAAMVLNETTQAKLRPVAEPNSPRQILRGPKISWVDPQDLASTISRTVEDAPEPETIEKNIKDLEPAMSDRFARVMQRWTIVWAAVIAVLFQVSTPELLNSLATSETRREAIIAMVPEVSRQADSTIPAAMSDDFVDKALARLAQDYPTRKDLFDQVSGATDSRSDMIQELRDVLTGVPEREAIVRRYGVIIDEGSIRDLNSALATANTAAGSLDMLDIRPWGKGAGFYVGEAGPSWQSIFGVLITAILLSFGAPFWFEQLKNVANLRDALARKTKP